MTTEYSFAKPVKAAGVAYRSYTEAMWAQLFTELRIGFEYEARTFRFPDRTLYTPDFYLPRAHRYVEVKNGNVDEPACEKANKLAAHLGAHVVLLDGSPKKLSRALIFDGRPPVDDTPINGSPEYRYAFDETYGHSLAAIVSKLLQPSPYTDTRIDGISASRIHTVAKRLMMGLDYDVSVADTETLQVNIERQRQHPIDLAPPTAEMLARYDLYPDRRIATMGSLATYVALTENDVF